MWMIQMKSKPAPRADRMGARQIYEALRDQIMTRVYGIDGLLPSSRALAGEMDVARSTVTVAYEQLTAEGFIETRRGARPRVARAVGFPGAGMEKGRDRCDGPQARAAGL